MMIPFAELREACERYNKDLYSAGQEDLTEQTQLYPPFDLSEYGWEEETFAVLSIPDVGIETAVYLGTCAENLDRGAADLERRDLLSSPEGTEGRGGGLHN